MQNLPIKAVTSLLMLALLLAAVPPAPVQADGTITVETAIDHDQWLAMVADGNCSLREAILNANSTTAPYQPYTDCSPGSMGIDTITFAANYTVTLGLQNELLVTSPIVIQGNGAANTIIEADATPGTSTYRVLHVASTGSLTLNGVTVRNGRCDGACVSATAGGGGIYNDQGTLIINDSSILGNKARYAGGIANNQGSLTVTGSLLESNGAISDNANVGGGIYSLGGTLNISDSTLRSNMVASTIDDASGGGIWAYGGSPILTGVTFESNTANRGGAMYSLGMDGGVGSPALTNVTFFDNWARGGEGGGMYNKDDAPTLTNVTFSQNNAEFGGGIFNVNSLPVLMNTVVADSLGGGDCHGAVDGSSANNLIEDDVFSCGLVNGANGNIVGQDPNLGPLASNGGPTQTVALLPGSPAFDAGDNASCASEDQRGIPRPQGPRCDIGAFEVPQTTLTFRSIGAHDGWILESSESSGSGGTLDGAAEYFRLGDNGSDKQYRGILSFQTNSLPGNAVLTSARLRIRKSGLAGGDPFSTLGKILIDIRKGALDGSAALESQDFHADPSRINAASILNDPVSNWYSRLLPSSAFGYVNLNGLTQFRLRFRTDDNDNHLADYLKFFSGNASAGRRPQLIISYYVP